MRTAKLGTLITWNKGAAWNPVRTQANIDGDIDATSNLVLFGATHSTTSRTHTGFYSSATAPGMILAVGSENISVADFQTGNKEGDMYFSRNGGVSFRKVLNSTNFCRFIDEGAAIVCVDIDQTNSLFYSIDEVATRFVNVTFSDNVWLFYKLKLVFVLKRLPKTAPLPTRPPVRPKFRRLDPQHDRHRLHPQKFHVCVRRPVTSLATHVRRHRLRVLDSKRWSPQRPLHPRLPDRLSAHQVGRRLSVQYRSSRERLQPVPVRLYRL